MKNGERTSRPKELRKNTTTIGSSSWVTSRIPAFISEKLIVEISIKARLVSGELYRKGRISINNCENQPLGECNYRKRVTYRAFAY